MRNLLRTKDMKFSRLKKYTRFIKSKFTSNVCKSPQQYQSYEQGTDARVSRKTRRKEETSNRSEINEKGFLKVKLKLKELK